MQTQDEIQELRLRQLERMVNVLVEGQSSQVQILNEQTKRLDKLERRMDRLEGRMDGLEKSMVELRELMTLVLDDLAFIKAILKPGG